LLQLLEMIEKQPLLEVSPSAMQSWQASV